MMNNKDGGPAYPIQFKDDAGMSLRDYFAGQALTGVLASELESFCYKDGFKNMTRYEAIANEVYGIADAMLKERNK